jgi:hypothetical protein
LWKEQEIYIEREIDFVDISLEHIKLDF